MRPCGFDVVPREVYRFVSGNLLDFLHLARRGDEEFRRVVRVHGANNMASALAEGRGAVAVTAHYGAWELIPRAVRLLGHRVGVVGRRLSGGAADAMLSRLRAAPGVLVLDRGAGPAALVRALRGNTAVGILIDQDTTAVDSEFVEFFGLPARTPVGPARIAVALSAPVVPLHARRSERGWHEIHIEEPIDPRAFERKEGALEITKRLTGRIEAWIREDPRQWVWFHERWCRRPPGSPGLR